VELADALEFLDRHRLGPVADRPEGTPSADLGRLLHVMGDPEASYPLIVVSGTGPTAPVARMIGAVLGEAGLTVGTLIDSQLEGVDERLLRNGEPIGAQDLADSLGAVADVEVLAGVAPDRQEVVTAAALGWFAQVAVDVAVLDLGGRGWEHPAAALLTGLTVLTGADPDQAGDAASLVAPGSVVVLGDPDEELRAAVLGAEPGEILQREVEYRVEENLSAVGGRLIDLRTPLSGYEQVFVPLHGSGRGDDAATAVAAAEAFFGRDLDLALVVDGLATVAAPGQFEVVDHGPLVVVDAAADPAAAEWVPATLAEDFDVPGRRILVVGVGSEADPVAMLETLGANEFDEVIVTTSPAPQGLAAAELAAAADELGLDHLMVAEVVDAVDTALSAATPDDAIVVTGSAALAGAARAHLRQRSHP
jgi:dihydrofolate synthase / folylpolyglutamate synthase